VAFRSAGALPFDQGTEFLVQAPVDGQEAAIRGERQVKGEQQGGWRPNQL
jgi:hypothetical protein